MEETGAEGDQMAGAEEIVQPGVGDEAARNWDGDDGRDRVAAWGSCWRWIRRCRAGVAARQHKPWLKRAVPVGDNSSTQDACVRLFAIFSSFLGFSPQARVAYSS